ncbi:MAG: AMIN-like domain-containing (lipo)protein, partial [Candidatus Limnocylindria bacterium]
SGSAEPSPSVQASADPSSGVEPPFSCSFPQSLEASGTDFRPVVLQYLRLGTHEGYDRIVFEYDGDTPEVEIDLAEPPFLANPSGMELSVAGSPVYRITLHGASKFDTETATMPYSGPTTFEPGYEQIVQFTESGDFEATHSWYLGVNGGTCLRVFRLADPARIVIDIQH